MKREVFNEDVNENITDVPDLQTDFNDYVNEEELLALEQEQQMIDMMEEQALLEQAEEQAVIDAYIEQQLIEQSLLDQADEEAQLEYEDQQQFDDEPTETKLMAKQQKPTFSYKEPDGGEVDDDEQDDNVPQNMAAHCQVLELMRQRSHLDIYVKKEEIMISSFGIARLKYKLNDNGWQWILNYLETGCHEDFGVDPLKVADIDCESRVKELIELSCAYGRIPSEAKIEICFFFCYGNLFFSIKRSDDFIKYLHSKEL